MDISKPERSPTVRQRLFEILEHGRRRDVASRIIDGFLVVLVVTNVAVVIAQFRTGGRCRIRHVALRIRSSLRHRLRD